jgi:tetratricopeptide (TPR) repeat protein
MKVVRKIVAVSAAVAASLAMQTAGLAQYSSQFTLAKVVKQGTTGKPVAGTGVVTVQVQVNADGSHKVIKVIRTTNSADNAAAMEIAQTSTYRPAMRGSTAVSSFYDFELKFTGKSVSNAQSASGGGVAAGSPAATEVDTLIRAQHYSQAISRAQSALASSPDNPQLLQLLGVAQYYNKDQVGAAQSFSRVSNITSQFKALAADAFATAAVKTSRDNPSQSLEYAQKSQALGGGTEAQFALGVAQVQNKQYNDAIANLKSVRDKTTDPKNKAAIDQQLLAAYLATNDTADANATQSEIKQLDPNDSSVGVTIANHYLQQGKDAMDAGKFADALKYYQQAAATGNPTAAVTANTGAAFAIFRMDKPDYSQAKSYADKALAGNPSDPLANFAEGIAYAGIYAGSHTASDRQQALSYLNKADQLAKAAGNTGLSTQIESQIKSLPQ